VSRAAGIALRLSARAAHRPIDTLALLAATVASLAIIVNAIFLQSDSRPAPFLANPARPAAADNRTGTAGMPAPRSAAGAAAASPDSAFGLQPVAARRNDPIAQLIGSASRVMAVQRALSEWGYGQIRTSGILDRATGAAIEKFERDRGLPVTGQLSDRLLREIATMTGRPIE
jgi:Putative peptidoglycan binding domain